jgi:hypothetical protein
VATENPEAEVSFSSTRLVMPPKPPRWNDQKVFLLAILPDHEHEEMVRFERVLPFLYLTQR